MSTGVKFPLPFCDSLLCSSSYYPTGSVAHVMPRRILTLTRYAARFRVRIIVTDEELGLGG